MVKKIEKGMASARSSDDLAVHLPLAGESAAIRLIRGVVLSGVESLCPAWSQIVPNESYFGEAGSIISTEFDWRFESALTTRASATRSA